MKKFILGFITGGIICAAVTGFAVEYAVTVNPFLVKVNGVESSIEGYNINDNTYFKLRDVADAVGGFQVGFTDNTITIDTATVCPMPTETPTASSTPAPTAVIDVSEYIVKGDDGKDYTTDGLEVEYVDGIAYVDSLKIPEIYDVFFIGNNCIYDKDKNKVDITIPTHSEYSQLIPLDFYNSTLKPLLENMTE